MRILANLGDGNLEVTVTIKGSDGNDRTYIFRSDDAPGTAWPVLAFVNTYKQPPVAPEGGDLQANSLSRSQVVMPTTT